MIVNVYDVAHGFCGYVRDEINGANVLFDCGYNEETQFHPVDEILSTYGRIDELVIQNCDEDHMDGLPHLMKVAGPSPFSMLTGNQYLTSDVLKAIKQKPYGKGLLALLDLKSRYTAPVPQYVVGGAGRPSAEITISRYCNPYPAFDTTNNLSMVTFVHGPGYSVVFPGDLEVAGWKELLKQPSFQADLGQVRIFIASHHGRNNGYCEEAFKWCSPDVVLISDEPMQFDTQVNCYANHAKGIQWNGGQEVRKVLTTRNDGHLRISRANGFAYFILASAA